MTNSIEDLTAEALNLPIEQRDELIRRLIASLEGAPDDTPEAVARAWDEEIGRRVADMEAGRTEFVPFEQVMHEARMLIAQYRK